MRLKYARTILLAVLAVSNLSFAAETEKSPVQSTFSTDFYGYIKVDASYDTGEGTYPGDYSLYANPKQSSTGAKSANGTQFNLTANQSRFGFNFNGPQVDAMLTSARLEMDFYAFNNPVNKATAMMRHAYILLNWKESDFSILAGQTSDIFSPLNPSTLNYTVMWNVGNIAYRRPQIQLQKGLSFGENRLNFQAGIARTIANGNTTTATTTYGNDTNAPTYEGRISFSRPLLTSDRMEVGFSGHHGKEHYFSTDPAPVTVDRWYVSKSYNVDLHLPLWAHLNFDGEYFTGQDLNNYMGGIGQGVNTAKTTAIRSEGLWGQLSMPAGSMKFNVGYGYDKPNADDLSNGNASKNSAVFGNAIYTIVKNLSVGAEVSSWKTTFLNQEASKAMRYQTSLQYNF